MSAKTYVYIAGPYMDPEKKHDYHGYHDIERNISRAREVAAFMARNQIPYFCPHLNSCHFEVIVPEAPPSFWYDMDLRLLRPASGLALVEGWEDSSGTLREIDLAKELNLPIFEPKERNLLLAWWREYE